MAVAAIGLLAVACGGGDEDGAAPATTEAPPTTGTSAPDGAGSGLDDVELELTEVARLDGPLAMTWCEGREEPYVAEKSGRIRTLGGELLLDLSDDVSDGAEQGLLGVTCSPDGTTVYASYTDDDGNSRVEAYPMPTGDGEIDRGTARTIFTIDQPASNHNGGNVAFGPDGRLWLGLGDGGGRDDRFENAQEPGEPLGSMLRLDLEGGDPEIVVKGLRNPWRWSFDRETDDLWIGDVGQDEREEIDVLPAGSIEGANLGWPAFEGTNRYLSDVEVPGAIPPVLDYGRDEGQSVVGGYVYRGEAIPDLQGAYLFADTYDATLRGLVADGRSVVATRDFGDVPGGQVASFAEDPAGELYVLSLDGGIFRLDPA